MHLLKALVPVIMNMYMIFKCSQQQPHIYCLKLPSHIILLFHLGSLAQIFLSLLINCHFTLSDVNLYIFAQST